jgi:hypothetical protein
MVLFHIISSPVQYLVLNNLLTYYVSCSTLSPYLFCVLLRIISPILRPVPYSLFTYSISCSTLSHFQFCVLFHTNSSPILCTVPYSFLNYFVTCSILSPIGRYQHGKICRLYLTSNIDHFIPISEKITSDRRPFIPAWD